MPDTAQLMAADRSPSVMSLMRAPVSPDLVDERLVAGPLEDDDGDVPDVTTERRRDGAHVLGRRVADVHVAGRAGSHAQLLEIRVGGVEQAALLGGREDRDRVGLAVGDQVRALERVDRDVDGHVVRAAGAHRLADPEHGRLVPLPLADDDGAAHLDLVHGPAHRLGGGAVRFVLLASAHEARRSQRRSLGDAHHLQGEQRLHVDLPSGWSEQAGPRTIPVARPSSVAEMAPAREHHGHVMPVRDLDGHLVADRATGLDDGGHAPLAGERMASANGK